ncbi:hypothetical protein BDD30_3347 [Photorhabdus asymbiotica]|uniref:Transposase n=1 Tax=Photorhabdus asymbiotica TaxID=291112 RepID=A0ABX9SHX9_9GAMM|nr:hypothetical protein BDD30_3347 [Photorhabdus asymbiotica]
MFRAKAIALFEGTFGESGGRTKYISIHVLRLLSGFSQPMFTIY